MHGHNTLLASYQNAKAAKKYPNLEKLKPEFPDQAKKKIAPSKFASTLYIFSQGHNQPQMCEHHNKYDTKKSQDRQAMMNPINENYFTQYFETTQAERNECLTREQFASIPWHNCLP